MTELNTVIAMAIEDILNRASVEERMVIFNRLDINFRNGTRKKHSLDLAAKVDAFSDKMVTMAMALKFKVDVNKDQLTILAETADAEKTLIFLSRGSEWFEGRDIGIDIVESLIRPCS